MLLKVSHDFKIPLKMKSVSISSNMSTPRKKRGEGGHKTPITLAPQEREAVFTPMKQLDINHVCVVISIHFNLSKIKV